MNDHQTSSPRFLSIWDALEDTPQEAANMRLRSKLLRNLQKKMQVSGLADKNASACLGITKTQLSDLLSGNIGAFSAGDLANLNSIIS